MKQLLFALVDAMHRERYSQVRLYRSGYRSLRSLDRMHRAQADMAGDAARVGWWRSCWPLTGGSR